MLSFPPLASFLLTCPPREPILLDAVYHLRGSRAKSRLQGAITALAGLVARGGLPPKKAVPRARWRPSGAAGPLTACPLVRIEGGCVKVDTGCRLPPWPNNPFATSLPARVDKDCLPLSDMGPLLGSVERGRLPLPDAMELLGVVDLAVLILGLPFSQKRWYSFSQERYPLIAEARMVAYGMVMLGWGWLALE